MNKGDQSDPTSARIFVQIASYRDPELLTTVRDCVAKASYPERLFFGLAWQHDGSETLAEFADSQRLRVFECHWRESQGACWARHKLQQLYNGEDYTLSLDSHHRFVEGWDSALIEQLNMLPASKPVLTCYLPAYDPDQPLQDNPPAITLAADRFDPEGALLFLPYTLDESDGITAPFRARFLSAHFIFARGNFLDVCGHDPELYFYGEEISLAVRAFTHGYDLFHPDRPVIYHRYDRADRPKHWDDHTPDGHTQFPFDDLDIRSKARLRGLLGMDACDLDFGRFGLGTMRSLSDYERYAGISFAKREISAEASYGDPPDHTVDA